MWPDACAFFHTDEQLYKVMLPFIREEFTAGDRAVHTVDPAKREWHLNTLSAAGIDAKRSQDSRQLEVRRWEEAYLRQGHFDQDAMLALIQEVLEEGRRQKCPMTRPVSRTTWLTCRGREWRRRVRLDIHGYASLCRVASPVPPSLSNSGCRRMAAVVDRMARMTFITGDSPPLTSSRTRCNTDARTAP